MFAAEVVINLECRAWAPNIQQDRKEQLGVLNYKIKIEWQAAVFNKLKKNSMYFRDKINQHHHYQHIIWLSHVPFLVS